MTLRDIAKRFGISHVTVSYALRGKNRVSPDLRDRICEAAREMGYRADPMLNALSNYRLRTRETNVRASLAWLSFWDPPSELHRFKEFTAYWQGAHEVAQRAGYRLEEFHPGPSMSLARVAQIIDTRSISGILLPPPPAAFPHRTTELTEFDWSKLAVVKFGHSLPQLRFHLVTSAHVFNAQLAMRRMRERGYRRIGFVTADLIAGRTQFLSGYLRAQVEMPEEDRVPFLNVANRNDPQELETLRAWIERHRPDAVLSHLRELPDMLTALKYKVPKDLGLAVLSVHDGNADSGVDQNPLEIGRAAAELLIGMIAQGSFGVPAHPREVLIEGSWRDGSTLPDRATPAATVAPKKRATRR